MAQRNRGCLAVEICPPIGVAIDLGQGVLDGRRGQQLGLGPVLRLLHRPCRRPADGDHRQADHRQHGRDGQHQQVDRPSPSVARPLVVRTDGRTENVAFGNRD